MISKSILNPCKDFMMKKIDGELLDMWSEPIAVEGFSTQSASNVASVIEDNIVNLLKALPPVYEVCSNVRSALKGWMVRNPKSPMMNWKTFSDLCQQTDLPGLVKVTAEGSMVEARRKAVARSMHNSGDVIYFEDLDFLVVDLDWFCHRVMGHLIKLSGDCSKLVTATDPDGFTSRAYLENVLSDSLKSSHELGCGGSALGVTPQNLVHLMLRLELCFENTTTSHGVGNLFIPTILDIGQEAVSWSWSHSNQNSIYFGRRLQCADPGHTFIPRGLFCRLQIFLHNQLTSEKDMTALRERVEVVERCKQALQIDEVDGVHDEAAMVTRGWATSSSSKALVNMKIVEEPSQEQNQALRELAHEVRHLAVVVHDTNNTVHEVGAHIALGLGHMVPNPNLEYGKAVVALGEGVLKDPPIDLATVSPGKLVRDEASAIRTAASMHVGELDGFPCPR
ncbi:unnamed protein product [Sphagnum tenellum]